MYIKKIDLTSFPDQKQPLSILKPGSRLTERPPKAADRTGCRAAGEGAGEEKNSKGLDAGFSNTNNT
jgi:hypothetical protein